VVPSGRDLLKQVQLDAGSPVLQLEGTSFDQNGRPVEVFSIWHHLNHVVFDIDIQRELLPAASDSAAAIDAEEATYDVAARARKLAGQLLRLLATW
jgi:GntR family transcriptional regulator